MYKENDKIPELKANNCIGREKRSQARRKLEKMRGWSLILIIWLAKVWSWSWSESTG